MENVNCLYPQCTCMNNSIFKVPKWFSNIVDLTKY